MKPAAKKIIAVSLSVLLSVALYFAVYLSLAMIYFKATSQSIRDFGWPMFVILFSFYLAASILLEIKLEFTGKQPETVRIERWSIYLTLFLCHCICGALTIPQPGGIDVFCRFLSPIMGPWSRFLPPNALTFSRCTPEYLIFTLAISILAPIFLILSYSPNRMIGRIATIISFVAIFTWAGYGSYRIFLDCM